MKKPGLVGRILAADSAASMLALIAVFVIFSAVNGRFLTSLNIHGIIVSAAISAITGLGMTLIIAMRALDLSVGSIMGFSAIIAAELLAFGWPLWLVIVAGMLVGCGLGLLNGLLIVLLRLPSFIATLATLSMILGGQLLITQGETVPIHNAVFGSLAIGTIGGYLPLAAIIAALIFAVVWVVFHRTPFGRHVAAIGGDVRAAIGAGINVNRVTLGAFTLVGLLAALSGMMVAAELQNADSTIGAGAELTAIAVVVVGGTSLAGGRGNLFGTVCAAVLLASIKAGLNVANVSSLYEDLVFGGILIVALMVDGLRRGNRRRGMLVV
ncbi:MAG TPA: ABC transporter permease [Acetobacteraceae bacterium]|nr:ABC transporter permease [Acetobacteraceae bacterium]